MLQPQLSKIIQGVETTFVDGGRIIRLIVPSQTLQGSAGAGDSPESWLETFEEHAVAIEAAARSKYAASAKHIVVLHEF